jgi:hypothetical protein
MVDAATVAALPFQMLRCVSRIIGVTPLFRGLECSCIEEIGDGRKRAYR